MDPVQAAAYAAKLEDHLHDQTLKSFEERAKAENGNGVATGSAGPVLPPASKQSIDELAAELKQHPFFATSLDDLGEDNKELDALKALAYEGTRAEIAENFCEQGNERAKSKDWTNAKEYYTKALAALRTDRREDELADLQKEGPGWEEREQEKEVDLKGRSLSNRALSHLNLKNYRSCSIDCIGALEVNSRNVKAHYRLAQALLALSKLEEALKAATTGLMVEVDNAPLAKIKDSIEKAIHDRDEKERKRQAESDRKAKEAHVLKTALAARQISTKSTDNPPELEDAKMTLTPDPVDPTSSLVVPVLVLYPLHAQTDFIKAFGEEQTFTNHLEYLLPLPWDGDGEYGDGRSDKAEVYLETAEGGLVKWGKKVELLRLLSGGKVEVVDGVVTVNVVPKARSGEWISEFKRRKGK